MELGGLDLERRLADPENTWGMEARVCRWMFLTWAHMTNHLMMVRSGAFQLEEDSEASGLFHGQVGVVLMFRD